MIASSTTAPKAITSPARVIVFTVAPRQYRTSIAAISDSGMVSRLIAATRHSYRKASRITTDQQESEQQRHAEVMDRRVDEVRLAEDGGVERDPGQAGLQRIDHLVHVPRDVERVAPRELLHDQQQARAVLDDGVTDKRLVIDLDVRDLTEAHPSAGSCCRR